MSSPESIRTPPKREMLVKNEEKKIMKTVKERKITLAISAVVLGEADAEKLSRGAAYAFTKGGRLLGRADLNSTGTAELDISLPALETSQQLRVLVGPKTPDKIVISEVMRLGGEEVFVQIEPKINKKDIKIQVIPKQVLCWLLSACAVQGNVIRKVVSGGVTLELPVCDATVEIYEVDPIYLLIPRLPDLIIEKIRGFVINPPPPPPPPIIREYKTAFTIGPVPPQPLKIRGESPSQLSLIAEKAETKMATAVYRLDNSYAETSPSVETMLAGEDMQKLKVLAKTTNTEQFRQILIDYAIITKFIICRFPYIIPHMDLVATATTAQCGKFKALFFRGCKNTDVPDLYFKVKQKIFSFLPPLTICSPTPIICHTYWNYKCGTHVTLNVANPLARTCNPCPSYEGPPNWVIFQAIGNHSLNKIRGTSVSLSTDTAEENLGLANTSWSEDAPFGEILRPRLEFDNSIQETLGVKYYRVSYRKGTSGQFIHLKGQIDRHYAHYVGTELVSEVYNLGPKQEKSPGVALANPNLFLIPPPLPPIGRWSIDNAVEDTASARFDTRNLCELQDPGVAWPESGLYQIKVELFDADGKLVNVDDLNIKFCVPDYKDSSGTIHMKDAADNEFTNDGITPFKGLVQDGNEDGKNDCMIIALNIDNSLCEAEILPPELDGSAAAEACGVMRYETGQGQNNTPMGTVEMGYRPIHPNGVGAKGFATYRFRVIRGANTTVVQEPVQDTPYPPIAEPNPPLSVTKDVEELLGVCDIAGFAEHLEVWAKATSGWRRLWEYDAEKVSGFALAPKSKTPGPPSP